MTLRTMLAATAGLLGLAASAQAATYSLAGSIGATPTFSITSGGVTATFSSPSGNAFQVQDTTGLLSFSTALLDNSFSSDNLTISFSRPIYDRIVIPFAILDAFGSGDTLSVLTSNSRSLTFTTTPDSLTLAEPEGVIDFIPNAGGLTSLTLSSSIAFAIGDVRVPEPMSLSLLGAGLLGFAASRRRG